MKFFVLPVFLVVLTVLIAAISLQSAIAQGAQNWTTYEDPILGIQFEHPSQWYEEQRENTIRYNFLGDPLNRTEEVRPGIFVNFAAVNYFLPPLPEGMNTPDKFMKQMMNELRSDATQNINVNRTSTIGIDDIPAYRVEYDNPINSKNIRYFAIDNSTGTGYMISLVAEKSKLNEFLPSFERLVESFKVGT
jgi:hypothetical protein